MTGIDITPSARRLTGSLRDIGYDLNTAVADLVDNAVEAGAHTIDIELVFDGWNSRLVVADDGGGMTGSVVDEALRFGTRREYGADALGRYGLGLKTASISQGRRLTVVTRAATSRRRLHIRCLDLDHIDRTDRWEVVQTGEREVEPLLGGRLDDAPGTVLIVDKLDRLLPERNPAGGWARRRFATLAQRLRDHLGMVFHRYLSGEVGEGLNIVVGGEKARPWDPFTRDEEATEVLPVKLLPLDLDSVSPVRFRPFVLPSRSRFSSPEAFHRAAGPAKWNRQQGLYIYRAGRLIQSGGWSGLRAADEHTKLARAAIEFDTDADEAFRINVAKMRVALPAELKPVLDRPVQELCHRANAAYRADAVRRRGPSPVDDRDVTHVGGALLAAAARCGQTQAFMRIVQQLAEDDQVLATRLGWSAG